MSDKSREHDAQDEPRPDVKDPDELTEEDLDNVDGGVIIPPIVQPLPLVQPPTLPPISPNLTPRKK